MFTSVQRLDPNNPADKEILSLVKKGLVEVYFDRETNTTRISLSKKGESVAKIIDRFGYVTEPDEALTQEDECMIDEFLDKIEKDVW